MRKLLASLLKYGFVFLVVVAVVVFAGYKLRRHTLPIEKSLQPAIDKLFIMVHLKEDTTGMGMRIDTTLTAEEELSLQIETRMNQLDSRRISLDSLELSINARQDSIEAVRDQLLVRQTEITESENQNLTKLAKLYAAMTPEQAAQILLQLPDQTAVDILYRMGDAEAGKLIEAIGDPIRSATIIDRYRRQQAVVKNED